MPRHQFLDAGENERAREDQAFSENLQRAEQELTETGQVKDESVLETVAGRMKEGRMSLKDLSPVMREIMTNFYS